MSSPDQPPPPPPQPQKPVYCHEISTEVDKWFRKDKPEKKSDNESGQVAPVSTFIGSIIKDYNSGQVMQELLQNCDDAGARHVSFMLDKRESCMSGAAVPDSLKPFMGPALLQYDDAMFKAKDLPLSPSQATAARKWTPLVRVSSAWVSTPSITSQTFPAFCLVSQATTHQKRASWIPTNACL